MLVAGDGHGDVFSSVLVQIYSWKARKARCQTSLGQKKNELLGASLGQDSIWGNLLPNLAARWSVLTPGQPSLSLLLLLFSQQVDREEGLT